MISLLIGVRVVNGILLPINLVFIWRLSRDTKVMGEHRNRGIADKLMALTVLFTGSLSVILVVVTLAGL